MQPTCEKYVLLIPSPQSLFITATSNANVLTEPCFPTIYCYSVAGSVAEEE